MNAISTVRARLAAVAVLLCAGGPAMAVPVTVSFTGQSTMASGDFAAATGPVSGSFTFDTSGTDSNGNPLIGYYMFSGAPYGFSADISGVTTLSGDTVLAQTSDEGTALPGFDVFQVAGSDGLYQAGIDWSGATSSFTGDGIPDVATLSGMNPVFLVRKSGELQFLATLSSSSFTVVPVPAAAWLSLSALAGLACLRRRREPGTA